MEEVFSSPPLGVKLLIYFLVSYFTEDVNQQLQDLLQSLLYSFREHPSSEKIVANRLEHDDIHCLAKALSDLSIGRQP